MEYFPNPADLENWIREQEKNGCFDKNLLIQKARMVWLAADCTINTQRWALEVATAYLKLKLGDLESNQAIRS